MTQGTSYEPWAEDGVESRRQKRRLRVTTPTLPEQVHQIANRLPTNATWCYFAHSNRTTQTFFAFFQSSPV